MTNNPVNRIEWIFDLLKVESFNYSVMFAKYSLIFGMSNKTFDKDWIKANLRIEEYQGKRNKAIEEASIAIEIKALESGLKSKSDRLAILQNQVDEIIIDLKDGQIEKGDGSSRDLNPVERAKIRQVLKEVQSEISRIDGDYAPIKSDIVLNKGFTFDIDGE